MRTRVTIVVCGALASGATLLAWKLSLLSRLPAIGPLVRRPGAPGTIATVVFTLLCWVLLAVLARVLRLRKEELVIAQAGQLVAVFERSFNQVRPTMSAIDLPNLYQRVLNADERPGARLAAGAFQKSEFCQRLDIIGRRLIDHDGGERAAFFLSGLSSLGSNVGQRYFAPLKALVWAMPGLGFIATTVEMAKAVSGMGDAVGGTVDYQGLRGLLVSHVIPHLAGAFDVTVLGLAASIVGFLAVAVCSTYDDSVGSSADMACLQLLSRVTTISGEGYRGPAGPALVDAKRIGEAVHDAITPLTQEVGEWTLAIRELKATLTRLLGGRSA